MYHHVKKLMYTVRVEDPDPRFGNMLLEQFGGANGELAAAMQYSIQGLNCEDPERKDLLIDIGTEELSHLEIVGALARPHLKPMKFDRRRSGGTSSRRRTSLHVAGGARDHRQLDDANRARADVRGKNRSHEGAQTRRDGHARRRAVNPRSHRSEREL